MVVSDVQPENIFCMSVTFLTLKLVRSSVFRALHSLNMLFIVVTFCVSKPDTSMLSKLRQSENMLSMLVTSLVFKYSRPSMPTRLVMPANQLFVVVGRTLANDGSNTTLVTLPHVSSVYQSGELEP